MVRNLFDVINTPGYVTLIEGQPGVGKTTLALKACTSREKCTYISYADPERSIAEKAKRLGSTADMKVINMMSGNAEIAFSSIKSALTENRLVIVDSIDAMFYGIRDEKDFRPFLQLLYSSVKGKDASVVMISEGLNPVAQQIRFVCDAIISMGYKNVFGQNVRAARLVKDRDNKIQYSKIYFTMVDGMRIFYPIDFNVKHDIKRINHIKRGLAAEPSSVIRLGSTVLAEIDDGVPYVIAKQYMEFIIFDYLLEGYKVNFLVPPDETTESILDDIRVIGDKSKNIRIIHPDAGAADYDPGKFTEQLKLQMFKGPTVDVVDLLSEENFAIMQPSNFELFLMKILELNQKNKSMAHIFGYSNLNATKLEKKYVKLHRRFAAIDGLLISRSIKPLGPLLYVRIDPEAGEMEFIEMN
ncbi:MAG: AAA family ATPase [Nitrososphaerota archaeon]|nr:AAA family ATPase [Nitrososphaerota archaeon]MDG7051661.1 AAA family ATPase [Nitrososphaerota archaeon]